MTPEEIQQARELAQQWVAEGWADSADATDMWARAVLSLTEQLEQARGATEQWKSCFEALIDQQSEPVSNEDLADAISDGLGLDFGDRGEFAYDAALHLLSRYTITRKPKEADHEQR